MSNCALEREANYFLRDSKKKLTEKRIDSIVSFSNEQFVIPVDFESVVELKELIAKRELL